MISSWSRLLSFLSFLSLWAGATTAADVALTTANDELQSASISYVLDPLEQIDHLQVLSTTTTSPADTTTVVSLQLSPDDAAVGDAAVRWTLELDPAASFVVGTVVPDRPHSCRGATHLSFWYKARLASSGTARARLEWTLLDDAACTLDNDNQDCALLDNLTPVVVATVAVGPEQEEDATLTGVASMNNDTDLNDGDEESASSEEWRQLRVPTADLQGRLTMERIRGYLWTVTAGDDGKLAGELLVDHVACEGGGDLLGAIFHPLRDWSDLVDQGTWIEEYLQSDISRAQSRVVIGNGRLALDYTVEQVEFWGGFVGLTFVAPSLGYYNLSNANAIALDTTVRQPASVPHRTMLRVLLNDGWECTVNCSTDYRGTERYYSFHPILDAAAGTNSTRVLQLQAHADFPNPFWFTRWTGQVHNQRLDTQYIKGITIETVLDDVLMQGSTVSGAYTVGNLRAVVAPAGRDDVLLEICTVEPELHFFPWFPGFRRLPFLSNVCCELCHADPECLYALAEGGDCLLASYMDPDFVGLINSNMERTTIRSFWMDDVTKRGDFCEVCLCIAEEQTIDCRGQNLTIVPKTFTPPDDDGQEWLPVRLDLRDNPELVLIGDGALEVLADSLLELWLPATLRYLAPNTLVQLYSMRVLKFEDDLPLITNAIADPTTGAFGEVCCSRGDFMDLEEPVEGLTFCKLELDEPGRDSTYEPFIRLPEARIAQVLTPSSSFMSEAAESVAKCAEFCSINRDCHYFSYDARFENAEHTCYFLEDAGDVAETVCCDPDHYAEPGTNLPGWTSGRPPRTRHKLDNATVFTWPKQLVADFENRYQVEYAIVLGSKPLRGAVWVEPVLSSPTDLQVSFIPPRVALYDEFTEAQVVIQISGEELLARPTTLVIDNNVGSCDAAFIDADLRQILVEVDLPPSFSTSSGTNATTVLIAALIPLAAILVVLAVLPAHTERGHANESIWKVQKGELVFDDPPKVIGRGSFGLVIQAEYRGTSVAVKRAIPPDQTLKKKKSMSDSISSHGGMGSTMLESVSEPTSTGSPGSASIMSSWIPGSTRKSDSSSGHQSVNSKMTWQRLKAEFVQEMQFLSKLRHPSITTVMGAVIDDTNAPLLIMEYMDHGSLYDMLHNETLVLEPEMLINILADVSQGIRFLHSANPQIIHGDLKASNILVDSKFHAKLSDFGMAAKRHKGATGTPYWMAPELLRGESTNNSTTDIYSLGVILFEVFSRRDPYEGEKFRDVLALVADVRVNKRPPVPRNAPPQLQSLMTECLEGDPEKRPTAAEVDNRLKRLDAESLEALNGSRHMKPGAMSLFDIFPRHIAEALRDGRKVEPESREVVTIFFSDIVGFTGISATLRPEKVADLLERLYDKFDALSQHHDVFKVETIGDSYMAVTNLVKDQSSDHARRIAAFAIDALKMAKTVPLDLDDLSRGCVNMRVGFHSGPVVANVVGVKNPRYCLFGDTVNTASRMESSSKENRIQCSNAAYGFLKEQWPELPIKTRGPIPVKGKGEMVTYWVNEMSSRSSRAIKSARDLMKESLTSMLPESMRPAPMEHVSEEFTSTGTLDAFDEIHGSEQDGKSVRSTKSIDLPDDKSLGRHPDPKVGIPDELREDEEFRSSGGVEMFQEEGDPVVAMEMGNGTKVRSG